MTEPKAPETLKPTDKGPLPSHVDTNDQLAKSSVNQQLDDFKHEKSLLPASKSQKESGASQSLEILPASETIRLEIHKPLPEFEPAQTCWIKTESMTNSP